MKLRFFEWRSQEEAHAAAGAVEGEAEAVAGGGKVEFGGIFPDFVNVSPKNHQRREVRCIDAVS